MVEFDLKVTIKRGKEETAERAGNQGKKVRTARGVQKVLR
jgi:hypothetical protein